jgi:membrane peptidoglycan carboxypeptidase
LNYGLASASRYYFSKDPKNLTKAEQIALLILPKDPKKYNPYKENKAFKVRFSLIVHTLQKNNILTETEAKNILTEERGLNYNHENILPYVADFIEHGYEKWRLSPLSSKTNTPRSATIKTTIDAALTDKIETIARNTILDLAWKDVSDYGIIILDRKTNELRTMI